MGDGADVKDLSKRVGKVEQAVAGLSQAQLDTRQVVDGHEDRCPMQDYSKTVDSRFDKIDTKFTVILTSGITVAIFVASIILGLYDSKVGKEEFGAYMSESREYDIRQDERIQTLFEINTNTHQKVVEGNAELTIEVRGLVTKIEALAVRKED